MINLDDFKKINDAVEHSAVYPEDAKTPDELIEKADYMLYKVKRGGKNRVCIDS